MTTPTMPALRFAGTGQPLRVEEVPVPVPGPGEVRVAVRACGVCGSDLHVVAGVTAAGPLPLTLGHEASGVVDAVGPDVTGVAPDVTGVAPDVTGVAPDVTGVVPGARVAVAAGYGCGRCPACRAGLENICPDLTIPGISRDGAQARYLVVPARSVLPLPDSIGFDVGAILTDAVATPFRAIRRSGVRTGQVAAVFGVGGLGLHAVAILRQVVGAQVVAVDPSARARERARAFGAAEVFDPAGAGGAGGPARQIRRVTGGVDAAFEFVGDPTTVDQALKSLRPGGTATVVGVTPERLALGVRQETLVAAELRLQGSFGSTRADLTDLLEVVAGGALDLGGTITHRFPLERADEAVRTLATRDGDPLRVVVEQSV